MDQLHLWAEESARDWTRQLVLVEVTAVQRNIQKNKPGRFG